MGYSVDALIINTKTLEDSIFPALRNGENDPLIKAIIQNLIEDEKACMMEWDLPQLTHNYKGLKKVMATFNESMTGTPLGSRFAVKNNSIEKIEHPYILPTKDHWGYEHLIGLIEFTIIKHCAVYFANLGSVHEMKVLFDTDLWNQIDGTPKLLEFFIKLDSYSNYYKHGDGGFGEGISGWLSHQEVKEANSILQKIRLEAKHQHPKFRGLLSLLEIFKIADRENKGLLVGRDLRINILNKYRGKVMQLIESNHVSGDGCVNFIGQRTQ